MGEEDEEFEVINHSLTSDGIIEEYYVKINGKLVTVPADEATILVSEQHGHKPKKKKEDEEKKKERHWSDPETPEEKEKRLEQDDIDFNQPGGKKKFMSRDGHVPS